jgi:hypothetical protein
MLYDWIPPILLPKPPPGWFEYQYSVLTDGSLALIRADSDILSEYRQWENESRDSKSPVPSLGKARGRISVFDGERESEVVEVNLGYYPIVDRFPDGRWLVADSRSEPTIANGRIFSADGTAVGAITLGDGIEHLAFAPDWSLWVGYFDEGVFGAHDELEPLGKAGIAKLDTAGNVLWRLNNPKRWLVSDCYAMSLTGNDLWSCVYMDFPIIRIRDGEVTTWSNSVKGAKAIAADDDYVILAGGYGEPERIVLLRLLDGVAEEQARLELSPRERFQPSLVIGRDAVLHVVIDGIWRRISTDTWRAHIGG